MSQEATVNHDSDEHEEHGLGHIVGYGPLFGTAFALIVLTILTVGVHAVDAGELNIPIALSIAGFKATLVCLYFMHLRWDRPFNGLMLVGSIVFAALLMVFVLMDSGQYSPQIIEGNPAGVQLKLDDVAPGAPITAYKQLD
ncbi:MAG: caa(3)-type oxidase subunit IV [Phycisphaerae bacterium]|nr:caa(3)-type oxidase subunit IV [Phycisphaerae bacterium]